MNQHLMLVLTELHANGPVDVGTITYSGGEMIFSGTAKNWYDSIREDFGIEAPQEAPEFFEWADKKFDGNYFIVSLSRS